MPDSDHIAPQDRLSQHQQISAMIFQILSVAQAGGLSEKAAKKIYHQILDAYSTMNGEAFWVFRDELIRILVTPDSHFSENDEFGAHRWN